MSAKMYLTAFGDRGELLVNLTGSRFGDMLVLLDTVDYSVIHTDRLGKKVEGEWDWVGLPQNLIRKIEDGLGEYFSASDTYEREDYEYELEEDEYSSVLLNLPLGWTPNRIAENAGWCTTSGLIHAIGPGIYEDSSLYISPRVIETTTSNSMYLEKAGYGVVLRDCGFGNDYLQADYEIKKLEAALAAAVLRKNNIEKELIVELQKTQEFIDTFPCLREIYQSLLVVE